MRLTTRWMKMRGDAVANRGRLVMMCISMAVGVAAVAAISTAAVILAREINHSYLATHPPSGSIAVDRLTAADLDGARLRPGVGWADPGATVWARIEVAPGEWLPLLLFVVPDFDRQPMNVVRLESGGWPRSAEGIDLEQVAMRVANATLGGRIAVQTAEGRRFSLLVSGVVHDPSLAPATQQRVVYGYVSAATLALLGVDSPPQRLNILATDPQRDPATVERDLLGVARWLVATGHAVGEIRIPPRQHPHWGQMQSVVRMLAAFSGLTFLLSAVLTAFITPICHAWQAWQIGVMKAVGARTRQITGMYLGLVAVVACGAVGLGLPSGILAGRALAASVGRNLNVEFGSLVIPTWLWAGELSAGVLLPVLMALVPIRAAARRTVRESLQTGVGRAPLPAWRVARQLRGTLHLPALTLALRNGIRRKARLVLTLFLLATAGALFMTALNVSAAWDRQRTAASAERHYDLELAFVRPLPAAALAVAAAVPGVSAVETFTEESVAIARPDGLTVTHTFADGGHGSLRLNLVPPTTRFVTPQIVEGRWLKGADSDAVVLNQNALAQFPGLRLGNTIRVMVHGSVVRLTVVGVVQEHLAGATLYATPAAAVMARGEAGGLRLSLAQGDEAYSDQVMGALERALRSAGFTVANSTSRAEMARVGGGHLYILIFTLVVMSVLMAVVGVLGLAAAMATGVLERTREFAILRAIGASRRSILCTVVGEGVFTGGLSVACAALLSLPVTLWVAHVARVEDSKGLIGVVLSNTAIPIWCVLVLVSAALASVHPARRASMLTIREALSYQ